ncbi:YoaK family protein [Novosphingobium sp.]|uniref:YoaK family protein n=1 Tax=Novosphingobium sp. TaxID=1874826 RepID=UPI003341F944
MIQYDRNRRRFAVALAALAGCVDAIGFLSANGYFVSFMSGNTTRLGVALGTAPWHALAPALLIAGFVGGVTGGSLLAMAAGRWRKPAITGLVALLLLIGAGARALGAEYVMLATLVLAMGAINNTFQRGGEVAIGLTYMTGALVRLGQGLALHLAGRPIPGSASWAWLWGGLLAGAVTGAFLEDRLPFGCLWIAAGWALIMVLVACRLPTES